MVCKNELIMACLVWFMTISTESIQRKESRGTQAKLFSCMRKGKSTLMHLKCYEKKIYVVPLLSLFFFFFLWHLLQRVSLTKMSSGK